MSNNSCMVVVSRAALFGVHAATSALIAKLLADEACENPYVDGGDFVRQQRLAFAVWHSVCMLTRRDASLAIARGRRMPTRRSWKTTCRTASGTRRKHAVPARADSALQA